MQMPEDKLCLQWNDFQENLARSFRVLREDQDFTDVTLVSGDGQQVGAHKVVLMTSSPFFNEVLKRNKHAHPLIYMKGVKSDDLKAIMDFLYEGAANVAEQNLENFLAQAEELKIEGLHKDEQVIASDKDSSRSIASKIGDLSQETVPPSTNSVLKPMKHRMTEKVKIEQKPGEVVSLDVDTALTNISELSQTVKMMMDNKGGTTRKCNVCGKEGTMGNLVYHIEAYHLTGIALPCPSNCGETFKTRTALSQHKNKCSSQ